MADIGRRSDWDDEDSYWRENYSSRPYASGSDYESWRPGYRYGYESASKHQGRRWEEVERDLERDWDTYEHGGSNRSAWQQIKDAVRDGWDRVTGKS
jgi:hypothetical protein